MTDSSQHPGPDNCFETAPEFVDEDNRQFRTHNRVSKEQMRNKHEVMFPAHLVKGRSVLDLGSCMGSTGHWCLSHGAKHYTGVEVQKEYVDLSSKLLAQYHPGKYKLFHQSIEEFFASNSDQFDIIALLGVIYTFVDYYSILKAVTDRAKEQVIFENMYPDKVDAYSQMCGVKFTNIQTINLGSENGSLLGRGCRISPRGLVFLMRGFSFDSPDGLLYPKHIMSADDVYNIRDDIPPPPRHLMRYLMRFVRTNARAVSLSEDLRAERSGERSMWEE